jgi:hypothetical protein
MVTAGGADPEPALTFAAANPASDAGWRKAVAGCDRGAARCLAVPARAT